MKASLLGLCFLIATAASSVAAQQAATSPSTPPTKAEQEILTLSKDKWRWMSEKKADTLAALFDDKAVFVHMGGAGARRRRSRSSGAAASTTSTRRSSSPPCGSSTLPPSC